MKNRSNIFQFPQIQSCAHLRIITCTMMCTLPYSKLSTKIIQRIASKGINLPCRMQRAYPVQLGKMNTVKFSRMLQTTSVERHVMSHKGIELIKVCPFYLLPHLTKIRGILRILRTYAMHFYIPVVIKVVFRTYQP